MGKKDQDWCLQTSGWKCEGSDKLYDISELEDSPEKYQKYYNTIFYRETLKEGYDEKRDISFNQTLLVTYSLKYRDYLRKVRAGKLERAQKLIQQGEARIERKGQNDVRRYIERTSKTSDGTAATKTTYTLDEAAIAQEARYDGFYAVCTNLEASVEEIIAINKGRWEIEESFRIMKSEFDARPVYLQRDERIHAHFLICFISLLIYRILEMKVIPDHSASDNGKTSGDVSYTTEEILHTLREMRIAGVGDKGYVPAYNRSELTDALHEYAGFRTDYEILRKKYMQGVVRRSKGL